MSRTVISHCEFPGVHRWPSCPAGHPHGYLKNEHRHTFVVECGFGVEDEDREVEIFKAEDDVVEFVVGKYGMAGGSGFLVDFGERSCETIAREVCLGVGANWCEVREDGKGGARYVRQ